MGLILKQVDRLKFRRMSSPNLHHSPEKKKGKEDLVTCRTNSSSRANLFLTRWFMVE
jgi:hypothetical protein